MTTRWTIGIDWERDGSYTDETARVLSAKWMLGFQQAYLDVGNDAQLTLTLRNDDRRFTPALADAGRGQLDTSAYLAY